MNRENKYAAYLLVSAAILGLRANNINFYFPIIMCTYFVKHNCYCLKFKLDEKENGG